MKCKISSFLTERQNRFKPVEANNLGLKRLHKIDFSGNLHIVEKSTNTNMVLIKPGDLVISGINVEKGAVAVYSGNEDILATIHYSSYEFDKKKIYIDYLKWFLKSDVFKKAILTQTKGGIKTELKPKKFLPLEIDLPDLPKQKEIIVRIQSIEKEIRQLEGMSGKGQIYLEKLRQAILSEAVQGKLVSQNPKDEPAEVLLKKINAEKEKLIKEKKVKKEKPLPKIAEEEIPYELPKGWVWCRLGEILDKPPRNGLSLKPVKYETSTKSLTLSATTSGKFDGSKIKYLEIEIPQDSHLWLNRGEILLQRSNSIDYVGVSAIYEGSSHEFIYPDLMMKLIPNKILLSKYLHSALLSPIVRKYFREKASGTSGNMPKVNQQIVTKTVIPLPPFAEQKRIVEKVDKLMKLCDKLEDKINKNKIHSEKLMDAVLRGVFE